MGQFAAIGGQILAGIGLSFLGSLFNQSEDDDLIAGNTNSAIGTLINTRSSQSVIPLCYGRCRTGINQVYINTRGSNQKYMDLVGVIGEGEIEGICYGTSEVTGTYDSAGTSISVEDEESPMIYMDKKKIAEWGNQVGDLKYYVGSSTQSYDTTINSYDSNFDQGMCYTAYIILTLIYDRDKYNSLPEITVLLDGLKIYNPIADTTEWTANAALVAYDYVTRPSTRGGMGIPADWIDLPSLSDAIDYCDDKGFEFNGVLNEQNYAADNLALILKCFRGKIVPTNTGKYKFTFRDLNYESVAKSVTEDDIVEKTLVITQPDILTRPNAIRIQYLSEDLLYQVDDYVFTDSIAYGIDGDYREITIKLLGVSTLSMVKELAYYYLERERNNIQVSFTGGRQLLDLEIEDVIIVTHDMPGWEDKKMRVVASAPDLENMVNHISCVMESTEFYDRDYDFAHEEIFTTNIMSPLTIPPEVSGLTFYEENYTYSGRIFTRLVVEYDPPDEDTYPWFDYAEIWVKIGASGEWAHMSNSRSDYVIDPAEVGEYYAVKLVSVSIFDVKLGFDISPSIATIVQGRSTGPTSMSYLTAVVDGQSINLYSDPVPDAGVDGYETRLGDSFLGGIFIKYTKSPSVSLIGVRPGTHTFWMSPVFLDAAGNRVYSETSPSTTVTIGANLGTPDYTQDWDYDDTGDDHDNTEQTTYNTNTVLACSHTSGVLTGTYTSPTWDIGSADDIKVWGDFSTDFSSGANTFEGIFGASGTFEDKQATAYSFKSLVGAIIGGQVKITLYHSTDNSNFTAVKFFEIFSADINTRYMYIEIEVTDPVLDANMYVSEITMKAIAL